MFKIEYLRNLRNLRGFYLDSIYKELSGNMLNFINSVNGEVKTL